MLKPSYLTNIAVNIPGIKKHKSKSVEKTEQRLLDNLTSNKVNCQQ